MIKFKTALLPWQEKAVEKLRGLKVGALYMDMSTGKTRTGLELAAMRLARGKVTHILWLCPYNTATKLTALISEHAEGWKSYITIAGIESLSTSVRLNAELLALARREKLFLVVDESTMVKNPNALRTRHIMTIAELCPYRLILSGTPITKCEADLFAQWYLLDWRILGYRSFWSFAANHLEYDPDRPGRVRRVLNIEYLAEKIAPYTYEVRRSDCFTLPQKVYITREFYLTGEQDEHYQMVSQILLGQVDELRPETIYRLFSALQSVTSGCYLRFTGDGDKYESIPAFADPSDNPRIQALLDALHDLPAGEKVLINCKYTHEIMEIMAVLASRGEGNAVPFYGEMPAKKRDENLKRFEEDVQYLVANKACTQYGLNLQFCHNLIMYDNDWDYATRLQAEDRLHRYGQTHPVRIIDIVGMNTIDVAINKCLMRKQDLLSGFKHELNKATTTKDLIKRIITGAKEG